MECDPTSSVEMVNVAMSMLSTRARATGGWFLPSIENVTVPVGLPPPAELTEAVNVTD